MSERRGFLLALLAAAALGVTAPRATAQDLDEWRATRDRLRARSVALRAELEAAEAAARTVPDDSLDAYGSVVRFRRAAFEPSQRDRLLRAFDATAAELRASFGDRGPELLAGDAWAVSVASEQLRRGRSAFTLDLLDASAGSRLRTTLVTPISVEQVGDFLRARATSKLMFSSPRFGRWLGSSLSLAPRARVDYFAYRQLALSGSSVARRCARGVVADCATVLDPSQRARWYDAGDAGARDRNPVAGTVRESLIAFASQRNPDATLQALRAPDDGARPVDALARAVNLSPDEFLAAWLQDVRSAGEARVRPGALATVAAFGWTLLFGFVATRRRPR